MHLPSRLSIAQAENESAHFADRVVLDIKVRLDENSEFLLNRGHRHHNG